MDKIKPTLIRYLTLLLEIPESKRDEYLRYAWSAESAGLTHEIEARLSAAMVAHESSTAQNRVTVRILLGDSPAEPAEPILRDIAAARGTRAAGGIAGGGRDRAGRLCTVRSPGHHSLHTARGSTLLFELLSGLPEVWTVGDESLTIIDSVPALTAASHGFESGGLTAADATEAAGPALLGRFIALLRDRDGRMYAEQTRDHRPAKIRFLEKTPRNVRASSFSPRSFQMPASCACTAIHEKTSRA